MSVLFACVGLVTLACDSVPLLAPSESTIIIASDRLILPVNGEATITATVTEQSGTAVHNGTLVTFSTSLGSLEPAEARTRNGKVAVKLYAGTESGTAVINAFSGSASATGESAVSIQIGAAAASALVLSVSPPTVPSTGGTVTVTVQVSDASGNRIVGVPVSFSADLGTLGSTSVVTNAAGEAKTTLRTDRDTVVTASAGAVDAVTFTVLANIAPTATVTVTTTNPVVGQATIFSVTVAKGTSTITGVTMNFGDGQSQSLGPTEGTSSVSHVYTLAGTYTATLTVTDAGSETVSGSAVIVVTAAPPINVNLAATPSPATVNEAVTFTSTASGSSVPIDRYEWNLGDGTTPTTSGGILTHVYTSAGTVTVTTKAINTDGVSGSTQLALVVQPSQFSISLTFSPSTPTSSTSVTFTAQVSPTTTVIDNYVWDFGDGTPLVTTSGNTTTKTFSTAAGKTFATTFIVRVTATKALDSTTVSTEAAVTVQP